MDLFQEKNIRHLELQSYQYNQKPTPTFSLNSKFDFEYHQVRLLFCELESFFPIKQIFGNQVRFP
jgi:hypothetical protein